MAEKNHSLLDKFKGRNKFFHSYEDKTLSEILERSQRALERYYGTTFKAHPEMEELILERARYEYNDSLEFFRENFQGELASLSLVVSLEDGDEG